MARLIKLVFAISATVLCIGNTSVHAKESEKGLESVSKAALGACWYEYLKIKPGKNQKSKQFINCYINNGPKKSAKQYETQIKQHLPAQYSECKEYMADPTKEFEEDFSAILRDDTGAYPYKGWAHCLVGQIKKTHGDEAISAMDEKWSSPSHPWMEEIHKRVNENRARHDAQPLKLNKELSRRAQKWAEKMVEKCGKEEHMGKTDPDYLYEGKGTGENLAQRGGSAPAEDHVMGAANGWYEEIRDYPWPEYKKENDKSGKLKIGHFTATVWKGSEQVGFGLGQREGCDKTYIVARFWPAGNMRDKYRENVLPSTD